MQVVNNEQTYRVTWKYENPELEQLLSPANISMKEFKKLPFQRKREILSSVGYEGEIPTPIMTNCIIERLVDGKYESFAAASIKRHKDDTHCKQKARTFSLGRVLRHCFPDTTPEKEGKAVRKSFWQIYLTLRQSERRKEERKVLKKYNVVLHDTEIV